MKVMVTGAAGYIGGQTVLRLVDAGHEVLGMDLQRPDEHLEKLPNTWWSVNDFASEVGLAAIGMFEPEAIIHCAGTSLVGPSIKNPGEYYNNNVSKTLKLLDTVRKSLPRTRIVFSSSAAVYGEPMMGACHEVDPCLPISAYGESKLMIDMMLQSYHQAYGLDYVSFRYFNACGADPQGRHGQEPGATHLIARVLESMRDNKEFTMYGNTYDTHDGSCVRDYVHVDDIARAHVLALSSKIPVGIYNLGSSQGTSVKQVVSRASEITGKQADIHVGAARAGDPPELTANSSKFDLVAGTWRHHNLDDMIKHAWNWYVR